MGWTSKEESAIRNILLEWHELSLGDISIICASVQPQASIMTVAGSAHSKFWYSLVELQWAEKLYSTVDPWLTPVEILEFRLTDVGQDRLPRFLIFYDLLQMGACTPAAVDTEYIRKRNPKTFLQDRLGGVFLALICMIFTIFIAKNDADYSVIYVFFSISLGIFVYALTRETRGQNVPSVKKVISEYTLAGAAALIGFAMSQTLPSRTLPTPPLAPPAPETPAAPD